jgi:hypothetical protein
MKKFNVTVLGPKNSDAPSYILGEYTILAESEIDATDRAESENPGYGISIEEIEK